MRLDPLTHVVIRSLAGILWLVTFSTAIAGAEPELPPSKPLTGDEDLAVTMMDGLHRFIERKIVLSPQGRPQFWQRDTSSPEAYEKSIAPNRARFAKLIGIVDPRLPVRMERFGDDDSAELAAETEHYRVLQVRWPTLEGVWGEGLLLEPNSPPVAGVVALPDAGQTPEQFIGLAPGVNSQSQFVRHLARNGFLVLVPALIDRSDEWSGNAKVAFTNQTHREWIYRQAYQMGRHIIGYEVQKVLSGIDWFQQKLGDKLKVGVCGYGEGGLIAFYSAAVDPRISACLVSGYFEPRERPWEEPLYRNVWSLLREFGDAEIATLVAPRALIVEYATVPEVTGPPPVREGRRGGAAAGALQTPPFAAVSAEFNRIAGLLPEGFQTRELIRGAADAVVDFGTARATEKFAKQLADLSRQPSAAEPPRELRKRPDPAARQKRQVQELERHVQALVRGSDATREQFLATRFPPAPQTLEQFTARAPQYRQYLWEEILGKLTEPVLPPNPRLRKIYDREKWVGYEVVLDVFPDVFAWGVLLVPKDIQPGERRPVVVCQHGRGGIPKDTIEGDVVYYHDFAAKLAERGFITFAPHNPYRGEDRYRFLSRKANSVKGSLFSFILAQHEQILNWLETLPMVDSKRIGFYGLSYGGETAVRVPPLLERYALSICSADFNDWARKITSVDARYSFMFTIEWEMPYFDLGSTFNYAEMASLMIPRPFMVERGHADGVAPDEWVAYEYAKVRRNYDQFGLGDRTEIEVFNGGHVINGQGTFRFLEKHLSLPAKK